MSSSNKTKSVKYKVLRRIQAKGRGAVFTSKYFLDLGSRTSVDQALSRLSREKKIRRFKPGLYDYPRINPKLGGILAPEYDKVAHAVARKTGSLIQPSGALAANMLGLTTQVPSKKVYLTNGPSRTIRIGNQRLVFRHTAPKEMAASGKPSSLVLQALRHLGRKGVNGEIIERLRSSLSSRDKADLAKEVRHVADWMRPVVEEIIKKV